MPVIDPPIPPPEPSSNFIRDHFAVLIVFFVFTMLLGCYMAEIHLSGNDAIIAWLQGQMNQLIGAMLMGLTGGVIAAKATK